MKDASRLLFISSLMFGTILSISSPSWLGAWMGLEINLLSFIPIMSSKSNQFATEAALKYFLTQALASIILFLSLVLLLMCNSAAFAVYSEGPNLSMMISTALLLKMGAAPFHFWFPGVMEGLHWINNMILMTWQKIAPIMLISYTWSSSLFSSSVILLSAGVGALGGLNQTSLRKIMAYSSINHLGWMLGAMTLGDTYWIFYFGFYCFLSLLMVITFHLTQLNQLEQVYSTLVGSPMFKLFLFLNLLSLGGLPPFLGFLPKWVIIQAMASDSLFLIVVGLVMSTLVTLYLYLRIGYSAFMITHSENKWSDTHHPKAYQGVTMVTAVSLMSLPICSGVVYLI